jgi:hypothetical protein
MLSQNLKQWSHKTDRPRVDVRSYRAFIALAFLSDRTFGDGANSLSLLLNLLVPELFFF